MLMTRLALSSTSLAWHCSCWWHDWHHHQHHLHDTANADDTTGIIINLTCMTLADDTTGIIINITCMTLLMLMTPLNLDSQSIWDHHSASFDAPNTSTYIKPLSPYHFVHFSHIQAWYQQSSTWATVLKLDEVNAKASYSSFPLWQACPM